MQIEEPYLEAIGATTYELAACYNVTVECKVTKKIIRVENQAKKSRFAIL